MPFVDLPHLNCSVFYVVNPVEPVLVVTGPESADIKCAPFDSSKPVLVMIHGNLHQTCSFARQFSDQRLKNEFNMIAISRIHHDRTKYWGDRNNLVTMLDQIDCTIAALDSLSKLFQFSSFSLVGSGIGGSYISIAITIRRQPMVKKLVLASPGLVTPGRPSKGMLEFAEYFKINKNGQGDGTGRLNHDLLRKHLHQGDSNCEEMNPFLEDFIMLLEARYGKGKVNSWELDQIFEAEFSRPPFGASLREAITIPILILRGEHDVLRTPLDAALQWKNAFKNSGSGGPQLHTIVSGYYTVVISCHNIVNRFILQFTLGSHQYGRKYSLPESPYLCVNSGIITEEERHSHSSRTMSDSEFAC